MNYVIKTERITLLLLLLLLLLCQVVSYHQPCV